MNLGSRITKSPKVYFTDIGLVNFLIGSKGKDLLFRGPQAGALFENFIIQETLKHYLNRGTPPPIFYYRSNNGLEVDLVIEGSQGVLTPCEIKLTKTPHHGMANTIERFHHLNKNNKVVIKEGLVISLAEMPFLLSKSIKACGLNEFLASL